MGLTGFNLARREEEEAAASAVASLSTEPEVCSMPEQKEAPKRGRKKAECAED